MTIKEAMTLLHKSSYKEAAMEFLCLKDKLTLKELKPLGFTQSAIKYHVARGELKVYPYGKGRNYLYSVEDIVKLLTVFKTKGNYNPKPRKTK